MWYCNIIETVSSVSRPLIEKRISHYIGYPIGAYVRAEYELSYDALKAGYGQKLYFVYG